MLTNIAARILEPPCTGGGAGAGVAGACAGTAPAS